jgi:hypothetical protein
VKYVDEFRDPPLWETVHVFFEHVERGHGDLGASAFLYPFLGEKSQDTSAIVDQVAASIRAKAADDERLRVEVARGSERRRFRRFRCRWSRPRLILGPSPTTSGVTRSSSAS